MAVVLVLRPWGLLGRPQRRSARHAGPKSPLGRISSKRGASRRCARAAARRAALAPRPVRAGSRSPTCWSSRCSPPACTSSWARAAWCRSATPPTSASARTAPALLLLQARLADGGRAARRRRLPARAGAALFGWFCVRLSGVYLAMLTLAFAQIAWSVAFQWDARHRRLERPGRRLAGGVARVARPRTTTSTLLPVRLAPSRCCGGRLYSPFGYALRAARDSPLRAEAIGIDVRAMQWAAFTIAGLAAGAGRRAVRVLQGLDLAGDAVGAALGGRPGHGAARRRADARAGPVWGAALLHLAAGRRWRAASTTGAPRWALRSSPSGADEMAALSVRNLSKSYGGVRALRRGVVRRVGAGEIVALIGPNGAGKTTCFNALNGQLAPDSGEVLLGGTSLVGRAAARDLRAWAWAARSRWRRPSAR